MINDVKTYKLCKYFVTLKGNLKIDRRVQVINTGNIYYDSFNNNFLDLIAKRGSDFDTGHPENYYIYLLYYYNYIIITIIILL